LFLRDVGETEVGGFAMTRADDLLFVEDVQLVKQECTWSTVNFLDSAVADYFDRQVEAGYPPQQCGRIWIHTHPGDSASPSHTDEDTFEKVFGRNNWAVMFILGMRGETYARLRFSAGPGGSLMLPVSVDHSQPFPASEHGLWLEEYRECVVNEDRSQSVDDRRAESERPWWDEQDWFRDPSEIGDVKAVQVAADREEERLRAEWDEYQTYYGEFY
jgi:hypothetical protein